MFLGVGEAGILSIVLLSQCVSCATTKSLTVVPGSQIPCGSLPSSISHVSQRSLQSPAADTHLHMLTLYHQCNSLFYWCGAGEQEQISGLPSHDILWGCAGTLEETLDRSIVAPLTWRQIDLLAQRPGARVCCTSCVKIFYMSLCTLVGSRYSLPKAIFQYKY